jgi:hypothetical protein
VGSSVGFPAETKASLSPFSVGVVPSLMKTSEIRTEFVGFAEFD